MIWVIGGTSDSREFIEKFPVPSSLIATTATPYGKELLRDHQVRATAGRLTFEEMVRFAESQKIFLIADLSHPYAREVSSNALLVSEKLGIPYFRYERGDIPNKGIFSPERMNFISFSEIETLADHLETLEGNILITLGSNTVEKFSRLKNLRNIFFRVLPVPEVLEKCLNSGILPKNILALQGPFSENMNRAMIEEYRIRHLVSKQSGRSGGEKEKIEACIKTGIGLIYLEKPELRYKNCFSDMQEFIARISFEITSKEKEVYQNELLSHEAWENLLE